jgi:hypothetical protein
MIDASLLTTVSIIGIVIIVGVVAMLNIFLNRDRKKREQGETFRLR